MGLNYDFRDLSGNLRRLNHFVNLNKSYIKILLCVLWVYFGAKHDMGRSVQTNIYERRKSFNT